MHEITEIAGRPSPVLDLPVARTPEGQIGGYLKRMARPPSDGLPTYREIFRCEISCLCVERAKIML